MAYYEQSANSLRMPYYASAEPAEPPTSHRPKEKAKIEMGRNAGVVKSGFKIVVTVLVSIFMVGGVVLSYTQDLEVSRELEAIQQEQTDLESDILDMRSEIAGKTSNKIIQEYAENVLGMRTIDPSQVEYVQIQTDDVVKIPEEEQNVFARVKAWFDNFVEYLRG